MLCTSGFVDDIRFPYNGVYRTESKGDAFVSYSLQHQLDAGQRCVIKIIMQVAAPRAKSAVSNCILLVVRLHIA